MVALKDVIRHLRKSGLHVVATVCDQGASNMAAINALMNDTRREYKRKGKECRLFGFEVDGEEIIPLYDVPHLLKAIRNNLLTKDCKFKWQKSRQQIASWKHILELFNLDSGNGDFRSLTKLTDCHVKSEVLKKMKVSVAAQVLSQRVSSTMRLLATCNEFFLL